MKYKNRITMYSISDKAMCCSMCFLIEKDKYLLIVRELQNYMNGKDKPVINQLISKMNVYSKILNMKRLHK